MGIIRYIRSRRAQRNETWMTSIDATQNGHSNPGQQSKESKESKELVDRLREEVHRYEDDLRELAKR